MIAFFFLFGKLHNHNNETVDVAVTIIKEGWPKGHDIQSKFH
jgi:hypothetical protein